MWPLPVEITATRVDGACSLCRCPVGGDAVWEQHCRGARHQTQERQARHQRAYASLKRGTEEETSKRAAKALKRAGPSCGATKAPCAAGSSGMASTAPSAADDVVEYVGKVLDVSPPWIPEEDEEEEVVFVGVVRRAPKVSEVQSEGSWNLARQIPDRCVVPVYRLWSALFDELMFWDGALRAGYGVATETKDFRTIIPHALDFEWKRGGVIGYPVRAVSSEAKEEQFANVVEFDLGEWDVDDKADGLWNRMYAWFMYHPGYAMSIRRPRELTK